MESVLYDPERLVLQPALTAEMPDQLFISRFRRHLKATTGRRDAERMLKTDDGQANLLQLLSDGAVEHSRLLKYLAHYSAYDESAEGSEARTIPAELACLVKEAFSHLDWQTSFSSVASPLGMGAPGVTGVNSEPLKYNPYSPDSNVFAEQVLSWANDKSRLRLLIHYLAESKRAEKRQPLTKPQLAVDMRKLMGLLITVEDIQRINTKRNES